MERELHPVLLSFTLALQSQKKKGLRETFANFLPLPRLITGRMNSRSAEKDLDLGLVDTRLNTTQQFTLLGKQGKALVGSAWPSN